MGKALMGRDIQKHAADKAWYAVRQMNLLNSQSEMLLHRMKQNETTHGETVRRQMEDLKDCQMKLEKLLEE